MQDFIQVAVVDTGVGIKEEDHSKLFNLFGFLEESQVMNTHGIGLGLVILKKIVEHLGGKVTFSS